ncbi:mannitol dehydrogenase family protein [Vibrio ziniensis]|uniref:Mannitol dehydrogenase family protein n=1 Tax=Vibrio ziniensis TaxID=2711221 RepID=A0A6G7CN56_9VIBR|nr:mannitol dehydrogenase family protein [Vibrio ziniensis]QIH43504.1 mannitol dehydrogenase family protein [Vibrio ziniensis]
MRLSQAHLSAANALIKPNDNNKKAKVGIVHLGFGAFHRAHQALITDAVIKEIGGDWKIVGVTWSSVDLQKDLIAQDSLYSVGVGYNDQLDINIVGSIETVLMAAQTEQVLGYMRDPAVKIVSLTVTEKGYCHNPATGDLDFSHPLIQHDLQNIEAPKSAIGFLVSAMRYRHQNGIQPFTPMTCDNLPENGRVLEKVVLQFAKQLDEELYQWIKKEIQFPCTMVDRIVPRTTDNDIARVEKALGLEDKVCVITEPFLQWVIEDKFVNDRPQWEKTSIANVQVTDNVVPFEEMKLRLLNGTHSTMAYLGYLSGYETVATTIQDPDFKTFVRYLMDEEITPSLNIEGIDLDQYKDQLIERYENKALQHRTWQIAMDGTQKIPQRFLQTIRYSLKNGVSIEGLCLALAAWMRYVSGVNEQGQEIDVQDPLKQQLAQVWQQAGTDLVKVVDGFLALRSVFDQELAGNQTFKAELQSALEKLFANGAKASVASFVAQRK